MELTNVMVDTKAVWVDFPGLTGFSVEVANLSRKELNGLRKRCTTSKYDRKTLPTVPGIENGALRIRHQPRPCPSPLD